MDKKKEVGRKERGRGIKRERGIKEDRQIQRQGKDRDVREGRSRVFK